jgi:hypothetical protein
LISPRIKVIIGIIVVAAGLVISLVLAITMSPSGQNRAAELAPWTPAPSATASLTATVPHGSENTPTASSTLNATLESLKNCTHPLDYWAEHTAEWPASVTIGSFVYTKAAAIVAFSQTDDPAAGLLAQVTAAYLNANSGADYSTINDTILAAGAWLQAHSQGGDTPIPSDLQNAQNLQSALADYNTGRTGPGLCAEIPTPTPTAVPSFTQTSTPTPTERLVPSETLAPTRTFLPPLPATATSVKKPALPQPTEPEPQPSSVPDAHLFGPPGSHHC